MNRLSVASRREDANYAKNLWIVLKSHFIISSLFTVTYSHPKSFVKFTNSQLFSLTLGVLGVLGGSLKKYFHNSDRIAIYNLDK